MKVAILCGGKGTRLKEQTEVLPKPLIEIGDKPILWHIMKIYSAFGFNDFILCLGYKGQAIKEYFMDYLSWRFHDFSLDLNQDQSQVQLFNRNLEKWQISFVDTGLETNTGGRVNRIKEYVDGDSFMVTYGDGVADVNIRALVEFHQGHRKIGTVTVVKPALQFGVLDVGRDGQVTRFVEKPVLEQWVNGGFFVFRKEFFDYLDDHVVLEQTPLERLAREGELMAYKHEAYWKCMDTYKDTTMLNDLWNSGNPAWKIW